MVEGAGSYVVPSSNISPFCSMNSPLRVFVIEDSPILLERIAEAIADQPSLILVGTADCEKEALAKIRLLKPEALVVDIKLREGNGLNVLAQLKWGEGEDAKPKIVVFTNYPRQEYLRNSKQLGADYFLDKSTQFSDLPKVLIGLSDEEQRSEQSLRT
jgi:DNA-binding NarL/FixJ family response regulator